jgi:hypothetical protein
MHFSFNVLRIKVLYMFRALFSHPQEAMHKRHLVYCVRVMSVDCSRIEVVQPIEFSVPQNVQTETGTQPASYSRGIVIFSPGLD